MEDRQPEDDWRGTRGRIDIDTLLRAPDPIALSDTPRRVQQR